jgi:hypothetical protein
VNDAPARQIGGKIAPRSRAAREALHLDARCLRLRLILSDCSSQFLKLQFQLLDEPLLRSERGPNISRFILAITNCRCSIGACAPASLALDQRRLQRGRMISCPSHDRHISTNMLIRATNLATAARHVVASPRPATQLYLRGSRIG